MKFVHWMLKRLRVCSVVVPQTKNFGYHEDKDCFVLRSPHFESRIGSGKIARRVYLEIRGIKPPQSENSKFAKRQLLLQQQRELLTQKRKRKEAPKGVFKYPNVQTKLIMQRWNRFQHPFTVHLMRKSGVTANIISSLLKLTKEHSKEQIIEACENGYALFTNRDFVFGWFFDKSKIGLDVFIETPPGKRSAYFNTPKIKHIRNKFGIEHPDSWLNECIKGWDYLVKTYCRKPAILDKHPETTKQAVVMMERHRLRPINDKGKEDVTKFVNMLFNYAALNKMDPLWLFDRIQDALNSFHTIKIEKTYYLTNNIFWSETLPNELMRFDKRGFENRELVVDMEKLLK